MHIPTLRGAAAAVGLFSLLSCGGKSPAGPSSANDPTITISIVGERGNASFSPNPALAAGRLVIFRNNDTVTHRVRLNDLTLDWGNIAPGASSQAIRMPAAGTNYHCQVHPLMIGAVAIDAETGPPPCRDIYC